MKKSKELGLKIKEKRMSLGLTQKEIAEATGLSLNVVKGMEIGRGFNENNLSLFLTALRILPLLKKY